LVIAPYAAVFRFARPGKSNAKIARRAGPKQEFIFARRNQQITKFHSKMLAEEQSRLLANPTTDAKVPAAATQWRLSNPDGCATLGGGNKANCY
jgi:hypothetical protein